jgi:hypothetical protein
MTRPGPCAFPAPDGPPRGERRRFDAAQISADFVTLAHKLDPDLLLGVSAREDFGLVIQVLSLPDHACTFAPLSLPTLSATGDDLYASLRQLGDELLHHAGRRALLVAVIIGPHAWDKARAKRSGRAA